MASVRRRRRNEQSPAAPHAHDGPCRGLVGIRCSTDEQLDRYGPDVQRSACLAAAAREAVAVDPAADVVVIAQSVTKYAAATELQALDGDFYVAIIERLKSGEYCTYVTYDMTRLTRSGLLHQLLLEQEVQRHAPRILYANLAGVDTTTPEGQAFKMIMAAVNWLRTVLDLARLAAAKRRQAELGFYSGETIPIGYVVRLDPEATAQRKRPTYRKVPYPPHVEVLGRMLRALAEQRGSPYRAARVLARAGVIVPDFEPELVELMAGRTALKAATRTEGGWKITPRMLVRAAENAAYGGVVQRGGAELGRDATLAIAAPELLAAARGALHGDIPKPRGRAARSEREPRPLAGLLRCLGPQDEPHDTPRRMSGHANPDRYTCRLDYSRGGDEPACIQVAAHLVDRPVAEYVLAQLRLGAFAADVVGELEQAQAERATREKERAAARRRLLREIEALEANLARLLSSEVVTPERFATIDRQIAAKRAELEALAAEPAEPDERSLTADQVRAVRDMLEHLEARWPKLSSGTQGELLRYFLEGIDLAHAGPTVRLRVRWITGRAQTLELQRPDYREAADVRWTAEADAALRRLYPAGAWEELYAALPGRTELAIRRRAHSFGLPREVGYSRPATRGGEAWTAEEDALLRRYAAGALTWRELIAATGRTEAALRARQRKLGLKREGGKSAKAASWRLLEEDDGTFHCASQPPSTAHGMCGPDVFRLLAAASLVPALIRVGR